MLLTKPRGVLHAYVQGQIPRRYTLVVPSSRRRPGSQAAFACPSKAEIDWVTAKVSLGPLGNIGSPFIEMKGAPPQGEARRDRAKRLWTGVRTSPTRRRHCCAVSVSYFGTPTNSAPINLPSSPISGA
jgi:hypothetical protein